MLVKKFLQGDPPAERLPQWQVEQAIAELQEIREWRYGSIEPAWLQPIWIPARELVIWRRRQKV